MRDSGCPDPRNDSQQKLKLFETHPRGLRRRRWLGVKEWNIRDSKPPRGRTGEEYHVYARFETTAWP